MGIAEVMFIFTVFYYNKKKQITVAYLVMVICVVLRRLLSPALERRVILYLLPRSAPSSVFILGRYHDSLPN
jgi:hypothetical protein